MQKKNVLVLCVTMLVLEGCAGKSVNETGGTVLGGAAGALVGSQFGGGAGQLVGTAIGAIGGAVAGNAVGKKMDKNAK